MEMTLTTAGLLAHAGASRLAAAAPAWDRHRSAQPTSGASGLPSAFVAHTGKNRLTRPLLELSP